MNQTSKPEVTYQDFKAYRPDGSLKADIIKAYLHRQELSAFDLMDEYIKIGDDMLRLIVHPDVMETIKQEAQCLTLISVQFRISGHVAIAVPYREARIKTKKNNWGNGNGR